MASAEDTEAQSDNGIYSFQAAPKRSGGRGGKIKSVTLADLASVQGQLRELSVGFPRTVEMLQGPGECWDTDPGNAGQRVGVAGARDWQRRRVSCMVQSPSHACYPLRRVTAEHPLFEI